MNLINIVIDGLVLSGKSIVVKIIVKNLNYIYFDIGVMYCCVIYLVL